MTEEGRDDFVRLVQTEALMREIGHGRGLATTAVAEAQGMCWNLPDFSWGPGGIEAMRHCAVQLCDYVYLGVTPSWFHKPMEVAEAIKLYGPNCITPEEHNYVPVVYVPRGTQE
jgi:hypothetical protein